MIRIKKTLLIAFAAAVLPFATAAQVGGLAALELTVNPPSPRPNQDIVIRARSFSIDLNRSSVSWSVNGKEVARGVGKAELATKAGVAGSTLSVSVVAQDPSGSTIAGTLTVRPADVDVLWEARSYAPPLYAGRALPGFEGEVTVVAVPHLVSGNTEISRKKLIYTWYQDGKILGNSSGYGRDSATVRMPRTSDETVIRVEVSSTDHTLRAEGGAIIPIASPRVSVYENSPTLGVLFSRALTDAYPMTQAEVSLAAYPYFFSTANPTAPALGYTWTVNGETVSTDGPKNTLVLRRSGAGAGSATVALDIANASYLLQFAQNAFGISFGESENQRSL